jgi:hypothetical protein
VNLFIRLCMSHRAGALRLLRWLLCALIPAWLCLGAGWAVAAEVDGGVDEGAPMCDPHGASVAAMPEVPEGDHGKLEQLPCDDAWLLWLGAELEQAQGHAWARNSAPSSPPPELQLERARLDGVIQPVTVMPGRTQPVQLPRPEVAGLPARPGHRSTIYRPPVRGR